MDREIPIASRIISRRILQRSNDIMVEKIMNMKFANFSQVQKSKDNTTSITKNKKGSTIKLNRIDACKKKRVLTVLDTDYRIKQENKMMYERLIRQRGMISNREFAEDWLKNKQYLKRIGKYPYQRLKTQHIQLNEQSKMQNRQPFLPYLMRNSYDYSQRQRSFMNVSALTNEQQHEKLKNIRTKIIQEQIKAHHILLYSKVYKIHKKWYTIKFIRLKCQYQIILITFPSVKIEYSLRMDQKIATQLLSQNDYDYTYIITNYIKVNHQNITLNFMLKSQPNKKFFYKFTTKDISQDKYDLQIHQQSTNGKIKINEPVIHFNSQRKTIFALQNQKIEIQISQKRNKRYNKMQNKDLQN